MSEKSALENPQTGEVFKRVCDEQQELSIRIDKLEKFIESDDFTNISTKQKFLLDIQLSAMKTYNQCLARIAEFQIDNMIQQTFE
jgi:hypothetical protein